ncbi:MAG: TolC family protein [Bacteroidales bacterium]|nr:TolC family protein [Bacteroidales bacterium]
MRRLLVCLIVLLPLKFFAQEFGQTSFTLEQAKNYAVENSVNVKNAKVNSEITEKTIWETISVGLPQANGTVNYQNIFTVPEMNFGGYVDWGAMDPMSYITPMDVFANYVEGMPIQLGVKQNVTWDVTVSQIIFNGEYLVGLQAIKTMRKTSDVLIEKAQMDVKALITETYVLVKIFEQNREVLNESLQNTKKLLEEMITTNEAGLIDKTSVDQFQLTVHNLTNVVVSMDKQIESMKLLLKYQMGMDINQEISLVESAEQILEGLNYEGLLLQEFNIGQNLDYRMLNIQEENASLIIKQNKSRTLPSLTAFYRHQEQMKTPDFNFSNPNVVGVTLSVPILSSGARWSRIEKAKLEYVKIQNTKIDVESALNMQVVQNRNNFIVAYEKYELEKKSLELAKKIYDNTLIMFRNGTASSLELTQAQNQMLTSQSNSYTAILELLQAKNNLDKVLNNY